MNTRSQDDRFTNRNIDSVARKVGYYKHVNIVACQRLAQNGLANFVFVGKGTYLVNEVALVCIRERVAVSEEHRVVIVCKL